MRFFILYLLLFIPLQAMYDSQDNEICIICHETLYSDIKEKQRDVVTLQCSRYHQFHFICLYGWHKRNLGVATCPFCRESMRSSTDERLFDYIVIKKVVVEPGCFEYVWKKIMGCIPARESLYTIRRRQAAEMAEAMAGIIELMDP